MNNNLLKPDCLPLIDFPVYREDSIEAARYLLRLEVDHGPLHESEIYSVLVGAESRLETTIEQRRICRQVSQVLASVIPNFRKYYPVKILSYLERA
jgi:hypothetical protein